MAKKKNGIALASVLAFEKKLVPSDGFLYGTSWEKRQTEEEPIALIEKSVCGTISNRLDSTVIKDPMKLNAKIENANPQTVDSASLKLDQDTLKLRFTLKVLSGLQHPSACNEEEHAEAFQKWSKTTLRKAGSRNWHIAMPPISPVDDSSGEIAWAQKKSKSLYVSSHPGRP